MTDLATKPASAGEDDATLGVDAPVDGAAARYLWAPVEPRSPRRRLWLWIGIPAAALIVGTGIASAVLIAPGTSIGGVSVGGMTPSGAAGAVQAKLAATTLTFSAPDGDIVVSAADLGASVDATALADAAFGSRPAWNVGSWFGEPMAAPVTVDPAIADVTLAGKLPEFYSTPTDAAVAFDGGSYVVTAGTSGAGVDLAAVASALSAGFSSGADDVPVVATSVEIPASTTTVSAQTTADSLNGMLDRIGFYVGEERTVSIDRAVAASWLTLTRAPEGGYVITADEAAIQRAVDGLPGAVDRAPVDATVITNTRGTELSTEVKGLTGRKLGATAGIAAAFAAQLAGGEAAYALPVTETPFETTAVSRNIVVDLGAQMTYLYENGAVIRSWSISSGKAGTPTHAGDFTVYAHVRQQNMGCVASVDYCTPDVPYVTYFNGDEAFHGTYWHSNFGTPMSHGCVNMRISEAQFVYNWAPVGTEVSVRS